MRKKKLIEDELKNKIVHDEISKLHFLFEKEMCFENPIAFWENMYFVEVPYKS